MAAEIDWAQEPVDERERELRQTIIRRIEVENAERDTLLKSCVQLDGSTSHVARMTRVQLQRLAARKGENLTERLFRVLGDDNEDVASDLRDALWRWAVETEREDLENLLADQRRLLDSAIRAAEQTR